MTATGNTNKMLRVLFAILMYFVGDILCYKPVFLLHGVLTGNASMVSIEARIREKHPGTQVYSTDRFSGWSSLETMWHQVQEFGKDIMNISSAHPEGIHLLGYSQGGLIARGILETFPNHNIQNFISLSAPQAGQYGTAFLHLFFPNLVCKTAFELFYSRVGQHTSVGNYWNDPHHQSLYYNYSVFLPYTNNELLSSHSPDFKEGLLKLQRFVMIGGPDDGVITPWQSSHFGYFDENETVVDLQQRDLYKRDLIGLRSLDKKGRLHFETVPGINHFQWHNDLSVIDNHILPYLD